MIRYTHFRPVCSAVLALTTITLAAVSCAEQSVLYSVTGTASQAYLDGNKAYMKRMDGNDYKSVDSCEVLHGNFHMKGQLDSVMCVWLFMGDSYVETNRPIPVVLESGDVNVNIDSQVKVQGTPLNDALYNFLVKRDSIGMMIADPAQIQVDMILEGKSEEQIYSKLMDVNAANQQLIYALDRLETEFVKANFDNVLGLTWFLQLCNDACRQNGFPTTTPQIEEILSAAPETFKDNAAVREYLNLCK